VDHDSCRIIHDPGLPTAGSDHHPGLEHHANFADHVLKQHGLQTTL
jgi:hypothetical protein